MMVLTCSGIWATAAGVSEFGSTAPGPPAPKPASLSASSATSRLVNSVPTIAEPSDDSDLAEEVVRARGRADLRDGERVLDDEHQDLHTQPHAHAHEEQVERHQGHGGVGGQGGEQEEAHRDDQASRHGHPLVPAGPAGQGP